MDAELKMKIESLLELTEQNNVLLKKMREAQRLSQIFNAIKWVVIIAVSFGSLVFIQPYINNVSSLYSEAMQLTHPQ